MSVMGRMKRIGSGTVERFLARVEDPELVFPQLIREMEDHLRAVTEGEAKASAAMKTAEAELDKSRLRLEGRQRGAETALRAGDETLAREAVASQLRLERDLQRAADAATAARTAWEAARAGHTELCEQLAELRAKKEEILARARLARSREKIQKSVFGPASSGQSLLDAVSRMEQNLSEREAALSLRRGIEADPGEPSLSRRLSALDEESEVDRRFAALREQLAGKV